MKLLILSWVCLVLLPSFAFSAPVLSCEDNSRLIRQIALVRDSGRSQEELLADYSTSINSESKLAAVRDLIRAAYILQTRTPDELARDAITSCDTQPDWDRNRVATPADGEIETLTATESTWCINQNKVNYQARLRLAEYDALLASLDAERGGLSNRIDYLNKPSITRAEESSLDALLVEHNSIADRIRSNQGEYRAYANEYNKNVEDYNQQCGGRGLLN